ncbi:MAG: hypothetical protein CMJ40_08400 [Phycisphaerae bacterium]|nr:hypothetical protein [Phycisphaerae bacterium]|tara:strand:+ start:6518 stop:6706 length:189 start_codon:yes stop_codon:yes gene_type:complete
MDDSRDKAIQLIKLAKEARVDDSIGTRLGQSVLFMAQAAAATHVSLLGGNLGSGNSGRGTHS